VRNDENRNFNKMRVEQLNINKCIEELKGVRDEGRGTLFWQQFSALALLERLG
jgi:hypothetical protein